MLWLFRCLLHPNH
ncbi:BgTH12-05607 [Blumeria graminis f. sp. triticale]|uniref:BgTH12-05607 n=1 Tax=Blumeria graminis f. sp. triticale TaxID=1689686 RepID=A0A9W4D481_BLUGR|nr:BgTH12-05607 [Blumeria graminis f. sp. triticale]